MAAGLLLAFGHQDIFIQAVTVKKLFPLVGQDAADSPDSCFNQTHRESPL